MGADLRGKTKSSLKQASTESDDWVVMGSSKYQEIRREKINTTKQNLNPHSSRMEKGSLFEEHHQHPPQEIETELLAVSGSAKERLTGGGQNCGVC